MPKLTTVTVADTPPPSRRELAERHLADLRARVPEMDRRGAALVAELEEAQAAIPEAALDAIEDQDKAPRLNHLRTRKAAIPGEITARQAAHDQLDQEIALAEGALRRAEAEEAATATVELTTTRERLAGEIDATLAALARQWAAYAEAGRDLVHAIRTLGIHPGKIAKYDDIRLANAVQAASPDLSEAMARPTYAHLSQPMADLDDSGEAREMLREAAGLERVA